jgi:MFS family permease
MPQTLRALRSRNFRLFFIGQGVSLIGTWMDSTAMSWLVYEKFHDPTLLGFVVFCSLVPAFILGPFAGVMVDRYDKRKLLMFTQAIQMLQAGAIAALVFTDVIKPWMIISLAVVAGLVGAVDMTGRQAFMVYLVDDPEDLRNAIALNSSQFNLARLIGPAVAGFVYYKFKGGWCFTINALSFLAVLIALYFVKTRDTTNRESRGNILDSIRQGASYIKNFIPVRALISLLAVVSFLSGAQSVMMPLMAGIVYKGNASTLGYISSAIGLGAFASAMALASRKSVLGLSRWIVVSVILYGSSLILVSFTRQLWLGLVILPFLGAGFMAHMASTNTLVQTLIDDKMRGRVMAFYIMSFTGTMPFGSLLAGAIAKNIDDRVGPGHGAPVVLFSVGVCTLVSAGIFMKYLPRLKDAIRPIYIEKGILAARQS